MRKRYRKSFALGLALLPFLTACNKADTQLDRVLERGELRVVTRYSATTYYEGPDGPGGLEYELAKNFADMLGVRLNMITAPNVAGVIAKLENGEADLAAAGLAITGTRQAHLRFSPPYQTVTQQLVYRAGNKRPADIAKLDGHLEVVSDSSHAERLRLLRQQHPQLSYAENSRIDTEELLSLVWERVVDYTVADSTEVALNRRFYPELRVAFDLTDPEPVAWAFRREPDSTLYDAAADFISQIQVDGTLDQVIERHYGHVDQFDFVGSRIFQAHIRERLPAYLPQFQAAAEINGVDWRLLAAMGYQESHWKPDAVSPTGVRGLMMLTNATAQHLGVAERTDPNQSIEGGARYLRKLIDKVPERIAYPDRLWFAVAAYNIGFGHLEDARVITQTRGGNPDRWMDVKGNLPLLRKQSWYERTKHGYARGNEALQYVENIRSYYDILVWSTDQMRTAMRNTAHVNMDLGGEAALVWPL